MDTEGVVAALPPVIKPVMWIPLRPGTNVPLLIQESQFITGDPAKLHNSKGLRYVRSGH